MIIYFFFPPGCDSDNFTTSDFIFISTSLNLTSNKTKIEKYTFVSKAVESRRHPTVL